jgi:tRNA pseudouridine55 synthase
LQAKFLLEIFSSTIKYYIFSMMKRPLSDLNFIEGEVLLFDKPLDWTSFDLVRKIRGKISRHIGNRKIKVGHAGTLDPRATGLIIICTGKKTKEIDTFQASEKEYIAELFLGATTPSFDLETRVDKHYPSEHISYDLVHQTLKKFEGIQDQVPPGYSAKWIDGQRAYIKARKGIEVEMKPVQITIHEIELLKFEMPELIIRIRCSKGTYIRSLANDIGVALNSGAYLANLQRTKIGDFSVESALKVEDFQLTEYQEQPAL